MNIYDLGEKRKKAVALNADHADRRQFCDDIQLMRHLSESGDLGISGLSAGLET